MSSWWPCPIPGAISPCAAFRWAASNWPSPSSRPNPREVEATFVAFAVCALVLTRGAPNGACATPAAGARLADVSISVVANPRSSAVNVGIAFESADGAVTRLAPVSLYPVDRPMRTRLRMPAGPGRLRFSLLGAKGAMAVRVGPIAWLEAEPRARSKKVGTAFSTRTRSSSN